MKQPSHLFCEDNGSRILFEGDTVPTHAVVVIPGRDRNHKWYTASKGSGA